MYVDVALPQEQIAGWFGSARKWDQRNRQGNIYFSAQTIRRRIKETALRCRQMRKCQCLSPALVASREWWVMQQIHWRLNQWQRVIFTDETRFLLFKVNGQIRVRREPRQNLLPQRQIRQHPPANVRHLQQMTIDTWRQLPQQLMRRLMHWPST